MTHPCGLWADCALCCLFVVQVADDRIKNLLAHYGANLDTDALNNFLPEGTKQCSAYLVNRVLTCKEIYIDISNQAAGAAAANAAAHGIQGAAGVGFQKSARAQVCSRRLCFSPRAGADGAGTSLGGRTGKTSKLDANQPHP